MDDDLGSFEPSPGELFPSWVPAQIIRILGFPAASIAELDGLALRETALIRIRPAPLPQLPKPSYFEFLLEFP